MIQTTLFGAPEDGPTTPQPHDAVTFHVQWDWEADTQNYYLSHWVSDTITGERIVGGSNRFKWKQGDGVGDCGLALRWLNEARKYLAPRPEATPRGR